MTRPGADASDRCVRESSYLAYFAALSVLVHEGTYFAYGTVPESGDSYAFPVLRSTISG